MIGNLARKRMQLGALAVLAALVAALFAATISSQTTGPRITSTTDSDFIIADGGNIAVSVTDGVSGATYTFQPIFGFVLSGTTEGGPATYTHQNGGPTGNFKIRATSPTAPDLEKTLQVGGEGTNLATVNLHLSHTDAAGTSRGATPRAATDLDEKDTSALGTAIFIHVEALNSLGNKSNVLATPTAANLSVTVFAVGGAVTSDDSIGTTTSVTGTSTTFGTNTVPFAVTRATAGTVRVFAVATISGETVQSEDLNLTFTAVPGDPANVSLSDGGTVAQGGKMVDGAGDGTMVAATQASLPVSATDTAGVDATIVAGTTVITSTVKGPDGKDVAADNGFSAIALAVLTADIDPVTGGNQPGIVVTMPANAAPGVYTVESTLGTSKDTATFTVTGPPTNVEVEITADGGTGLGAQLTATATVTDTNGNLVAPTDVKFTVSQGAPATFVGIDKKTKDGVVSRNAVITGTGVITVIATSNGVSGVDVIVAGAVDAPAPDPALASISVEVVGEDHSAGSITVLASLADADGEAVEGIVSFYHSGDATLFGPKDVVTSDGTATAEYHARDDFIVLAVAGSHRASVSIEVTSAAEQAAADQAEADRIAQEEADAQAEADRIAAEAAAAEAAAAEAAAAEAAAAAAAAVAAETERLTGMTGFQTWLSEHSTSASALFAALAAEGATALWQWNGSAWVRYATRDGSALPGSTDFSVDFGAVLYISN